MYLQLADNGRPVNILDHMLQVQDENGQVIWVREDMLDDLPDSDLWDIIQSQPHMSGIKDVFANMKARKDTRVNAKAAIKNAKAGAIASGTYVSPLDKVIGAVGNVFTGGTPAMPETRGDGSMLPYITGGASVGVNKWYQNPLTIGGIAILGLGTIYLLTRNSNS